ncbi:MAG TPA: murein biosynthesis integral membrane protein MurJ, partial [Brevundimonas sp.]|nr:murein biosynthesis integral membrane protein MurJ [Brevundimonas sp.]
VSAAAWTNVILLAVTLWRRGLYRPSAQALSRLARIGLSATGLALIVGLAASGRSLVEAPIADMLASMGSGGGAKEAALLVVTAAGGLAYVVLAFATRAITVTEVKGLLRRTAK